MGAGLERRYVSLPDDDVTRRPHRTGDEPGRALVCLDRTLTAQPHTPAHVELLLGEVVVAVDPLDFVDDRGLAVSHEMREVLHDAVHHLFAVEQSEVLSPVEIGDVRVEFGCLLDQVGKIRIGKVDVPPLAQVLGDLDVILRELVSDTAASRVQEQPDAVAFIECHLDEVVTRAQRSELKPPVVLELVVEGQAIARHCLEFCDADFRRVAQRLVVDTCRERNGAFDAVAKYAQVAALKVACVELGFDRDHSAADIDSDGGGHDCAFRRNDRTHRRSRTEVRIRHQCQMWTDKRHLGRAQRLLASVFVEYRCPVPQPLGDLLHQISPT